MQPTTQSTPPETIEKRSDVSDASTPASRSPRFGALATCVNSIPDSRPRRWSGVTRSSIVLRSTALKKSAPPATASRTSAGQSVVVKPNAAIATPQAHAAIVTASPWRRTCDVQPGGERADERAARTARRRGSRPSRRRRRAGAARAPGRAPSASRTPSRSCRRRRSRAAAAGPSGSGSRRGSSCRLGRSTSPSGGSFGSSQMHDERRDVRDEVDAVGPGHAGGRDQHAADRRPADGGERVVDARRAPTAAAISSSGTSRGVERAQRRPAEAEDRDGERPASTKSAQTCGCASSELTRGRAPRRPPCRSRCGAGPCGGRARRRSRRRSSGTTSSGIERREPEQPDQRRRVR